MSILDIHILLGTVGLVSGFVAVASKKGCTIHRIGGLGFLIFMGASVGLGCYEAFIKPERITVIGGLFSVYLMITGWLSVKKRSDLVRLMERLSMLVALTIALSAFYFAYQALNSPEGLLDGFAFQPYVFFGVMAAIALVSDIRWSTRAIVEIWHRLTRHLSRMCVAMLIVEASVFLGQSDVFPTALQRTEILLAPLALVGAVMIYWLVKLRLRKFPQLNE